MRLRSARHEDLLAIGRVASEGLWGGYAGLLKPDTIARMLAADYSPGAVARRLLRGGVVVAETERGVSGFVDAIPRPEAVEVSAISTAPDQQRRGVGRSLIGEVLRRHHPQAMCADVLLGNVDAEGFFEHLGFVPGEVVAGSLFDEDIVERRWWWEASGREQVPR